MEKKQTAVQWLYDRLKLSLPEEMKVLRGLVVVAKEMEKEQMIEFASYYTPLTKEELEIGFNHKFKKQG